MLGLRTRAAARPAQSIVRARTTATRSSPFRNVRFQSTQAAETAKGGSGALLGGVAGGSLVFGVAYLYYHFSGAKTAVNAASQAQTRLNQAFEETRKNAPSADQALDWLRDTTKSYARYIPGAAPYVDAAFQDIDKVREKHGDEVDKIVKKAYEDLKKTTDKGASLETATEAWQILQDAIKQIGSLAADAGQDIINNHPQLKEKVGGRFQQLKQMGDEYGPEAKKQVDDTWKQVQDILKGGLGAGTIVKVQQLIQDKTEQLKKYGDQAWQKGIEEAKPLLDKKPELKELFEKNKQDLLKGDLGQLWKKVKEATSSGDTSDLQSFVKEQTEKAKEKSSGGISQLLGMIPGGEKIGPQIAQLQEVSQKHGKEAENLLKSTFDEIKTVLDKKLGEAKKLGDKAQGDAKEAAK